MYSKDEVLNTFHQEEFQNQIIQNIKDHHSIYTTPIDGIYFEEIINNGLRKFKIDTDWDALDKSHKQGVDVCGYSLKTCRLQANKFSITSFRTTSQKTLEDKIQYINNIGNDIDGYVVCIKQFNKKNRELKYWIYQFDHGVDFLDISNYDMKEATCGYAGTYKDFKAKITFSMSHQLIFSDIKFDELKQNPKCHLICGYTLTV